MHHPTDNSLMDTPRDIRLMNGKSTNELSYVPHSQVEMG